MDSGHGRRAWTKEEIEDLLAREDFSYQNIELPFGLGTGGHDRSATAAQILPADLTGKSVVDIGCSFGFFCFEAVRRGAGRVVGYDVDAESIRKARLLAEVLGADIEFTVRDVEREPLDQRFDLVLCLNVLHHLKNPIGALDNMIAWTKERLVLETASLGRHDRRKVNVGWLAEKVLSRLPIIFVSRSGTQGDREVQKFFITPSAIENLLVYQRRMFARVDQHRSEHKDRHITIAEKRRIKHLLVISGPTSSGKKSLARRLLANELPELACRIGTPEASVWGALVGTNRIERSASVACDRLLLYRDFMRPYLRSAHVHERDEANDILDSAERITFVTVWTPPPQLVKQITDAEIAPAEARGAKPRRHRHIRELYRNPDKVIEQYERWFAFADTRSRDHIVVSSHEDMALYSIPEWRARVASSAEG